MNTLRVNTIRPLIEQLRSYCIIQLRAHGLVRQPVRRKREIQMEFPWNAKR